MPRSNQNLAPSRPATWRCAIASCRVSAAVPRDRGNIIGNHCATSAKPSVFNFLINEFPARSDRFLLAALYLCGNQAFARHLFAAIAEPSDVDAYNRAGIPAIQLLAALCGVLPLAHNGAVSCGMFTRRGPTHDASKSFTRARRLPAVRREISAEDGNQHPRKTDQTSATPSGNGRVLAGRCHRNDERRDDVRRRS